MLSATTIIPGQGEPVEPVVDPGYKISVLLAHAALGRRLLPTNWVENGRCSCMQREVSTDDRTCSRNKSGKHPRISQWQTRASDDTDQVLAWHNWLPLANWGWVQTDTFTLDVDPGRGGLASLTQWEEEAGGPTPTLTQRTPSGGYHFIYRQPPDEADRIRVQGDMLPGIEIRGIGSYIMLDPSRDARGHWSLVNPDVAPSEPSDLIIALIERHGIDTSQGGDGVERRGSGGGLARGRGRRSDGDVLPATEWFIRNGFGGHSGSRNKDAYRLAWRLLAHMDRFPDIWTVATVSSMMRQCWLVTDQGDAPFPWDECLGALQSAWRRRERQKREDADSQRKMAASLVGGM